MPVSHKLIDTPRRQHLLDELVVLARRFLHVTEEQIEAEVSANIQRYKNKHHSATQDRIARKYYDELTYQWLNKMSLYLTSLDCLAKDKQAPADNIAGSPEALLNCFITTYLILQDKIYGSKAIIDSLDENYQNYISSTKARLAEIQQEPQFHDDLNYIIDSINEHHNNAEKNDTGKTLTKSHKVDNFNKYISKVSETDIKDGSPSRSHTTDEIDQLYGHSNGTSRHHEPKTYKESVQADRDHSVFDTMDDLKRYLTTKYIFGDSLLVVSISYKGKFVIPRSTSSITIVNVDPQVLHDCHSFKDLQREYPVFKHLEEIGNLVYFDPDDTNPNNIEQSSKLLHYFGKIIRTVADQNTSNITAVEIHKAGARIRFMNNNQNERSRSLINNSLAMKSASDVLHQRGMSSSPKRLSKNPNTSAHSLLQVAVTNNNNDQTLLQNIPPPLPKPASSQESVLPSYLQSQSHPNVHTHSRTLSAVPSHTMSRPPIPNAPSLIPPASSSSSSTSVSQPKHQTYHTRPQAPLPSVPSAAPIQYPQYDATNRIFGIKNYENTCYINSMMQCLFNIYSIREFFVKGYFKDFVSPKFHEKVREKHYNSYSEVTLSLALGEMFRRWVFNVQGGVETPVDFLQVCRNLKPDFRIPREQQDTSQFFYFLTDRLHEELNVSDTPENRSKVLQYSAPIKNMFLDYSNKEEYLKWHSASLQKDGTSPINSWFEIQTETSLSCQRCGFESKTYEHISMLTLNLFDMPRSHGPPHIQDMIENTMRYEELSDANGNAWNCPRCEGYKKTIERYNKCAKDLHLSTDDISYKESSPPTQTGANSNKDKHSPKRFRIFRKSDKEREREKEKDEKEKRREDYSRSPPSDMQEYRDMPDTELLKLKEEALTAKTVLSQPNVSYKRTRIMSFPEILVVYVQRIDPLQNKLNNPVMLDKLVDLNVDLQKNGISEGANIMSLKYKLNCFILHQGSDIAHGHYQAYADKNGHWYCLDDSVWYPVPGLDNEMSNIDRDSYVLFYTPLRRS